MSDETTLHAGQLKEVKAKIEYLINKGFSKEAKQILQKYYTFFEEDTWLCTTRAVLLILDGKLEDAKSILKKGIERWPFNADILFNLAYVYELQQQFQLAYDYYSEAKEVLNEKEVAKQAITRIKETSKNIKDKKKIAFFVKPGLDNFLNDIVSKLSSEYKTKKIIVTDFSQIDKGMEWADICWFEWCDELVIYGSNFKLAKDKKILCRLHSYEAFTSYIHQVQWNFVDKIILVADHIKKIVLEQIQSISETQTIVIPNGINTEKYSFEEREKRFNIAYVGYINYKKGPMLLLQVIKALFDVDNRYKLYIAGKYQDPRYELYFNQMINEMGLGDNIIFDGWQENINKWLEDKHYIISSSVLESQHLSVMEAMTKGIKPVIHNFVGAKKIYPEEWVWNTINEAVEMIQIGHYNSINYRKFIEDHYSLSQQMESILQLLEDMHYSNRDS